MILLAHRLCPARSRATSAVRRAITPATLIRYSLVPRLSSIGRQAALTACASRVERGIVDRRADERLRGLGHQQHGRRHRPDRDPRRRADAALVEGEADRDPDHRDVHLGARGEAQIGVAGARGPRRQEQRHHDLVAGERGLAGADRNGLDRHLAHAVRPRDPGDRAGRHQGRHAVGGRRGIAQVAAHGGAALDLDRADQLDPVDHARPGLGECRMPDELHAGHRGADAETAAFGDDLTHLGDLLDVDQKLRLDQVGFHLDDDVGAAGEHAGGAARPLQERHRRLQALRRFVSEFHHHPPRPISRAFAAFDHVLKPRRRQAVSPADAPRRILAAFRRRLPTVIAPSPIWSRAGPAGSLLRLAVM